MNVNKPITVIKDRLSFKPFRFQGKNQRKKLTYRGLRPVIRTVFLLLFTTHSLTYLSAYWLSQTESELNDIIGGKGNLWFKDNHTEGLSRGFHD